MLLTKEAVHELGHARGLIHCNKTTCVMYFSNSLSDTDIKEEFSISLKKEVVEKDHEWLCRYDQDCYSIYMTDCYSLFHRKNNDRDDYHTNPTE
jgi:hypothetical protein